MDKKSKTETFIGFALRAGKYRIGLNSVQSLKRANVIVVCKTASDNTKKLSLKIAAALHCKMYVTKNQTLSELTHIEGVKIIAITDKNLAAALINNSEGELTIFNLENIYG